MTSAENAICELLRDAKPVGLGFAIAERRILTCAHVVNTALGRPKREATDPGPADLQLRFPIGVAEPKVETRHARLAEWLPSVSEGFDDRDLAVLDLNTAKPDYVTALRPSGERDARDVQMWGPQRHRPDGGHVRGRLLGTVRGVRTQVEVTDGPFRVRPGFSGGPVWEADSNRFAGILVACGEGDAATDAYLLATPQILRVWPGLIPRPAMSDCPGDRWRLLRADGQGDLFTRIRDAVHHLPGHADAEVRHTYRGGPEHLLVTRKVPIGSRTYREDRPLLLHRGDIGEEEVHVLRDLRRHYLDAGFDIVEPTLIHTGGPVPPALREIANRCGVMLASLAEFQTGVDIDAFSAHQQRDIEGDPRYPAKGYVSQRFREPPARTVQKGLRERVLGWLAEPEGHLIVVLAPFGHGKTYLLHEIARHLHDNPDYPARPVFVRLSELDRTHKLDEMVALQLHRAGQRSVDFDRLTYLRRQGRIALLLDGFDELARRVSYDHAAAHLHEVMQAADGRAKIVLTSRREFFLSDSDVELAFGKHLQIAGRRMVIITDFERPQIHEYLASREDSDSADSWLSLLDEMGLLSLAANPRMLSMLTDIGRDRLAAASAGAVTKAWVFDEVLKTWLGGEYERANPHGTHPDPWIDAMRATLTTLAFKLWSQQLPFLVLDDLRAVAEALTAVPGADRLTVDEAAQRLGSGALLVRLGDNEFDFLHRSVMEWLITRHLAILLNSDAARALEDLLATQLSPLQIDLLSEMADRDALTRWVRHATETGGEGQRGNAVTISQRLGIARSQHRVMIRQDLRGQDFTGADLSGADLSHSDLADAVLVRANLAGANLTAVRLDNALLREANLRGANLSRASLTKANLDEAILMGATVTGANLTDASLCGADLREIDWRELSSASRAATLGAIIEPAAVPVLQAAGAGDPHSSPQLQLAQAGPVAAIAFHPHGELLAVNYGRAVTLWNLGTGLPARQLTVHCDGASVMAFSPDGRHFALSEVDGSVRVWETATGVLRRDLIGHAGIVKALAFSPDGQLMATGGRDGSVRLWETATGRLVHAIAAHASTVLALVISSDGGLYTGASGGVRCWDIATGQRTRDFAVAVGHMSAAKFSPKGRYVALGDREGGILLCDTLNDSQAHLLNHTGDVRALAFSADGDHLAAAGKDCLSVWDVATGHLTSRLPLTIASAVAVAFHPNGQQLASGGSEGVLLWNISSRERPHAVGGQRNTMTAVAFSADGRHLATSGVHGTRIWNTSTARQSRQLDGSSGTVTTVAFSHLGSRIATGGDDGTRVRSTFTGKEICHFTGQARTVACVAFSPEDHRLAVGGTDGVHIWDIATRSLKNHIKDHNGPVWAIAYSPTRGYLATGGADGVRVMGAADGSRAQYLGGRDSTAWALAYSPSGHYLAAGNGDGTFSLWAAADWSRVKNQRAHAGSVMAVAFSPDGAYLATGGEDGIACVWQAPTGHQLLRLQGHTGAVTSVAFSPDGQRLATASGDGTARVWNLYNGEQLACLMPLPQGWAVFLPHGRYKYEGDPGGLFWWASGLARLEADQVDAHAKLRIDADVPLW